MFSCLSADDSLPFSSMEALSVLWVIFLDFSSHEGACSEEKCVLQNHGWLVISLVLSPFPPDLTAGAVDGLATLGGPCQVPQLCQCVWGGLFVGPAL